jgi:hypothetical protein
MDNFDYDSQPLDGNSNPEYVKKQQRNIKKHEWFEGKLEFLQDLFHGRLSRSQFMCSLDNMDVNSKCPNVKTVTLFKKR